MLSGDFPCTILHRRNLVCDNCTCNLSSAPQQLPLSFLRPRALPPTALGLGFNDVLYSTASTTPNFTAFASTPSTPSGGEQLRLTPSGRAIAVGGRLRNISTNPMVPRILFWPDNEPLPDPGQLRPAELEGAHQPPILNTGNRGPITQQPGDWVCQKCNYLNWRRRKICQTCYPYADGNMDSTMEAERMAHLVSVLSQIHLLRPASAPPQHARLIRPQIMKNSIGTGRSITVSSPASPRADIRKLQQSPTLAVMHFSPAPSQLLPAWEQPQHALMPPSHKHETSVDFSGELQRRQLLLPSLLNSQTTPALTRCSSTASMERSPSVDHHSPFPSPVYATSPLGESSFTRSNSQSSVMVSSCAFLELAAEDNVIVPKSSRSDVDRPAPIGTGRPRQKI